MPHLKRLFCSKPFKRFEATHMNGGDVFICCPAWLDTPIGNLKNQSVEEIWNSAVAQDIRRSVLDGTYEYCNQVLCPFLQTVAGPVQRIEDVKDPELRAAIDEQLTTMPYGPRDINCAYDRSCNLSCPSCRTRLIVETQNEEGILRIEGKLKSEALKDAHILSITGSGDPFGSPYFRKWLRSMTRADMPNLQKIHLHTNAQLWTSAMWESIPKDVRPLIKSAEISIDAATAQTYAVNRRGGRFEVLLKNLEFVSTLRKKGPLTWLNISMVVQENNFEEMPAFVRLGKRFGVDRVYFSQLINWGTFSAEELDSRTVHNPKHPRHEEFLALLRDKIFDDPAVLLGNLVQFRKRAEPVLDA
jgi:MoaA/NifB/PqqE/SkfB family radical SAM enzyme